MGLVTPARRREFGAIKRRASGKYSASYIGPDGVRRFGGRQFATKADAQAWLAQRQAELYTRTWVDPTLGRITLTEYGTRWIAEHKLSPRTRDLYAGIFRLHIDPLLGARAIEEIKPETVRWWRARLRDDGRSESTTAKAYRLLRAIFNAAIDDGRVTRNPCRIRGADRENPPERPVASVAEVFDLADRIGPTYRAFILTAALASLRWGELVALRRRDIDLDEGLIFVRSAMVERGGSLEMSLPKNSRTRIVALPGVLVDELRAHLLRLDTDPDVPVFTGERGGTPHQGQLASQCEVGSSGEGRRDAGRLPVPRPAAHRQPLGRADGRLDPRADAAHGALHGPRRHDLPARHRRPVTAARRPARCPGQGASWRPELSRFEGPCVPDVSQSGRTASAAAPDVPPRRRLTSVNVMEPVTGIEPVSSWNTADGCVKGSFVLPQATLVDLWTVFRPLLVAARVARPMAGVSAGSPGLGVRWRGEALVGGERRRNAGVRGRAGSPTMHTNVSGQRQPTAARQQLEKVGIGM